MTSSLGAQALVPDSSVAAKWYLADEDDTEPALRIRDEFRRGIVELVVPDCFYYELTAIIRKAERRRPPRLTTAQADPIVADIAALPIPTVESRTVLLDAFSHSRALDISIYDALYLALAQSTGATFVTADRQLYDRVRQVPFAQLLAYYGGPSSSPYQPNEHARGP